MSGREDETVTQPLYWQMKGQLDCDQTTASRGKLFPSAAPPLYVCAETVKFCLDYLPVRLAKLSF